MSPYYDDGQVVIYHADARDLLPAATPSVAAVVTSPPYNVGLGYDTHNDAMPWPEYWQLATSVTDLATRALIPAGRIWVNTAVSVPHDPPGTKTTRKRRVLLATGWAQVLERAGLELIDQIAWCSPRGTGTAWGSWRSPCSPNLRGDWEAITVACKDHWERTPPPLYAEGWRDSIGNWQGLCSTVWQLGVEPHNRAHPAPYPVEVAQRCIRLSTWPAETVLDPFMGTGSTLIAARDLGRRAIGIDVSEAYCETAARRLSQSALDFGGAA